MSTLNFLQKIFSFNERVFIEELYSKFLEETPNISIESYYLQCFSVGLSRFDALNSVIRSKKFEHKLAESITLLTIIRDIMARNEFKFIDECYRQILSIELSISDIQKQIAELKSRKTKFHFLRNVLLNPDILKQNDDSEKTNGENFKNILWDIYSDKDADFLSRIFSELLVRTPSPEERKHLISYSAVETYEYLINSTEFEMIVTRENPESHLKHLKELLKFKDEIFITEVYRDCLGREPDLEGFTAFFNSLKSGTSKLSVLRTVMLSEEASRKILDASDKYAIKAPDRWSDLWPYIKPSFEFKAYILSNLVKHNLPFTTNIIVKTGGMGDFVQMTAVAKALKEKEPDNPIVAIIPHSLDLFEEHPYIDLTLESGPIGQQEIVRNVIGLTENVYDIRYISRAYGSWRPTKFFRENEWYYNAHPNSDIRIDDFGMHVCDLALISLGLEAYATCNDTLIVPDEKIDKITGNYVIVCNSVGSSPGRLKSWVQEEWDGLINWLIEKKLTPVQLGKTTDTLINSRVIDLRGKTTLRQSAGYIKFSKAYIGVEGGLFHLAKAVRTPAIVIFATTPDVCFAYPDTVVVTRKICRPCWWTEPWSQSKCMRSCQICLNLPDWKMVAGEISKLLRLE